MTEKEFSERRKPICIHAECKTGARCYRYNLGHKCDRCLTCVRIEGFKAGQESKLSDDFVEMIEQTARAGQESKEREKIRQDEREKVLEEVDKKLYWSLNGNAVITKRDFEAMKKKEAR